MYGDMKKGVMTYRINEKVFTGVGDRVRQNRRDHYGAP